MVLLYYNTGSFDLQCLGTFPPVHFIFYADYGWISNWKNLFVFPKTNSYIAAKTGKAMVAERKRCFLRKVFDLSKKAKRRE